MISYTDEVINIRSYPSLTYMIDFENGTVRGQIDNLEAVRQAVQLMLETERNLWVIYDANYGSDLKSLIGKNMDYSKVTLKRYVSNCLKTDDRVKDVKDFEFTQDGHVLTANFKVITSLGTFTESVSI